MDKETIYKQMSEQVEMILLNLEDMKRKIEAMPLITDTLEWKEYVAAFATLDRKLQEMKARDEEDLVKQNIQEEAELEGRAVEAENNPEGLESAD